MPGARIGQYELVEHLATGGMGRVYLGRTTAMGEFERHVVIKTLDTAFGGDPQYVTLFLDEARVLGKLHHQHIAPVFELGVEPDGSHFLVMEYIHGRDAFAAWLRAIELGTALPLDFAVTICTAVASALQYAHTRSRDGQPLGIVHRDVSLSNVMLGYDGAVKLIDFGIARAADRTTKTQAGTVKGKLSCMSPEQVNGKPVDHRTDIFALGILLYELTTMTRAFRDRSDLLTLERIRHARYEAPSRIIEDYPRGLELIVAKALQVDPNARFQDAETMCRELVAFGHRNDLLLGDLAVTEVMAQLFEQRAEPWEKTRRSGTDLAVPVEIDLDDPTTMPVEVPQSKVRRLRAATEMAEEMVIEVSTDPAHIAAPLPVPPRHASTTQSSRSWRSKGSAISAGVVVLAIGGAIAGYGMQHSASAELAPVVPIVPALPTPVVHMTPRPAPEPTPPTPANVHLKITTSPSDATLLLDGVRLGHTPFEGDVPAAPGPHVLKIRRRGHAPQKLNVDLTSDVVRDIALTPLGSG